MECRTIDITILSAEGLKKVNIFSKMEVYVVVSVHDSTFHHHPSSFQKQKTPTDKTGNKNPRWNYPMKFTLNDAALQGNRLTLHLELFSRHTLLPDSLIGEVHVPASDLISSIGKAEVSHVSYQVRKRSGKPKGVLNFSYKLGDKSTSAVPDTTGVGPSLAYPYPAPPVSGYPAPLYAYPAQPVGAGYGYPAPVNGYGYGAPQQVVQPQGRRNNFGMGMGTGLLGGALAGLVVGDLVSDMGHDGGYYDGGFEDGGFGF